MVSESESIVSSSSSLALSRRVAHNRSPSAQSVSSRVSSRRSSYHTRSKSQLGQTMNTSPTNSLGSVSFASESAQADDEDEGDEAYERSLLRGSVPSTPSSGTAASHSYSLPPVGQSADNSILSRSDTSMTACSQQSPSIGDLAKEFGVEPHLVEALLQRLGRG